MADLIFLLFLIITSPIWLLLLAIFVVAVAAFVYFCTALAYFFVALLYGFIGIAIELVVAVTGAVCLILSVIIKLTKGWMRRRK